MKEAKKIYQHNETVPSRVRGDYYTYSADCPQCGSGNMVAILHDVKARQVRIICGECEYKIQTA
jgi:transcription elongation factor Elf1